MDLDVPALRWAKAENTPRDWAEFVTLCNLRKRCYPALRWIEAMGKRSIWGTKYGWFKRCS